MGAPWGLLASLRRISGGRFSAARRPETVAKNNACGVALAGAIISDEMGNGVLRWFNALFEDYLSSALYSTLCFPAASVTEIRLPGLVDLGRGKLTV